MASPRHQSYTHWSQCERSERQGRKGTTHCGGVPFLPLDPLHPSSLGVLARFAKIRGQPLDQASELCSSDSLVF